jgi:AcrR family transcriptional regulator
LERRGLTLPAEQLARELGIKRPTLLYHFPTYRDLVTTVLGDLLVAQAAFVAEAVERHTHPIDRIDARVRAIHAFHAGNEAHLLFLTQAVVATAGEDVGDVLRAATAFFEEGRREMVARVERGIAEGTVHPCDAQALVSLVRAVVDGLTIQRVTDGTSLSPVYAFLWERVLEPLKRTSADAENAARKAPRRTPPNETKNATPKPKPSRGRP